VGKANGSRECAPDDKLRVPTITRHDRAAGTARTAPLLTLQSWPPRVIVREGGSSKH
jgi:hypothetical protein